MKLLLVALFFVVNSSPISCDKFEFGVNVGQIVFTDSGKIGLFEKVKRIPVTVPQCMKLTYVRLDVNNALGPPAVDFNWDISTVIIKYRPLQYSISDYTVVAKAVPSPFCNGQSYQDNAQLISDELIPL